VRGRLSAALIETASLGQWCHRPPAAGRRNPDARWLTVVAGKDVTAAAITFGDIHGLIRGPYQRIRILENLTGNRDTNAGTDPHADSIPDCDFRLKGLNAASRHRGSILRARDTTGKNDEFISAEPCHGIFHPGAAPNTVSGLPKRLVPDIMSVAVINGLESIKINKQDGKPPASLPVERKGTLETLLK
jgi:hypothetical protein